MQIPLIELELEGPDDEIAILWVSGSITGKTECPAWRGQYEIERLEGFGRTILGVCKAPFLLV